MCNTSHLIHNWIPYRLTGQNGTLIEWLYVDGKKFTEPFFDETIVKCKSFDINSRSFSSVSSPGWLIDIAQQVEYVSPTAFIFHVSRCGSTLLSQLLSLNEDHIVLSEVPLLDELLRLHANYDLTASQAEAALQASVRLMGQKRTGHEKHFFIKLDSWHIASWKTIRRLYPEVPFVLLYRSPDEVVQSHARHRGMQMVPGIIAPALLGFAKEEISNITLDEYTAKVLEKFYSGLINISQSDSRSVLVNYEEGIMNIIDRMAVHSGITFDENTFNAMEERSRYHSKHPGQVFSEQLPRQTPPRWLQPAIDLYNETERQRKLHR